MTTRSLLVLLAAVNGCAPHPLARQDLLKFLAPGTTTRADVILHLGDPTGSYEGSRILTYRLDKEDGGYVVVDRGPTMGFFVRYALVLVFDEQGVLQKHSLVPVRSR